MYLKSLEVHGFKSFANKLIFEFHNGITAIVGPNGSGKSNVADAVRWVLGEQSAKQLRGAKMEDIIFAGTQMRKPLGYAYVAITINNEDHKLDVPYEEVKIARRVYRSGESEYLLNGTSCRLRDIQELLFDTGIGKEGYSIIGQGQIDKILSGKPEERRELFDEAAGIVKFKKRKAAAEKNLAEEQQNLQQIELILTELEKQVGPLEKQSEKAREFLRLRDDLRTLDVNMFLMEYGEIEKELETVQQNQQIAQADLEHANQEFEQIKAEYEQVEKELEGFGRTLEESKESLATARVEKNEQEGNIKVLHEQIIAIEQNEGHFAERLESLEESICQSEKERAGYQEQQEHLDEKLSEMRKQQQETEKDLKDTREAIKQAEARINGCNNAIRDAQAERTNMESERERTKTLLEQTNIKRAEMTQKVLENKSKESELLEAMEEQKRLSDEIKDKIEGIDANIAENRHMIAELERKDKQLEERHREAEKQYHMANSRLTSLQNMAERYEGFGQSIRRVMERKERHTGIIGVVADIIRVDKEYEVAIETALGGSIQNIVTSDAQTAKDMIEYLKKNRYGRATFLPLTDITGRGLDREKDILKEEGVLGIGSMLVETDARFEELMKYLLGRIVVTDHIDHALALARKYHHSLRIVTKEGELINPGGSISGGAYKNNNNLLGRHHEMDDLKKEVDNRRKEIRQILQEQEQSRQRAGEQKNAMEDNRRVRQELVIQQNTIKVKYDRARGDYQQNQDDLEQIRRDSQGIEQKKKELSEKLSELEEQIEESKTQTSQNDDLVQTLGTRVEELRVQEGELSQKNNDLTVKLSTESQSGDFAKQNIDRIDQDLEKYQSEKSDLEENSRQALKQKEEKQQEIRTNEQKIREAAERITQLDELIETVGKKKDELTAQHKDFIEKREHLSETRNSLDKECFRLGEQEKKLEERRDNRTSYMWEEYELTYHKAEELKTHTDLSLDQMKQETGSLRTKIKNLGDVNVNAIEEYQSVMERFTELKKQHDDLIEAAEALEGIIQELDDSMRKQFEEQFEEIKNRFDMVFKELFGGGRGTLELMEEEDLLTAGIKINAQPPGKKLQNMMQLSGGEKALTAIALLFAIQSLKPSPFCLLDEIEAALDDSNVNRYAEYLHNLTKDTQFIVITHRRGTMNAADILYGITMQEKGVSTLVSVNLLDEKEIAN